MRNALIAIAATIALAFCVAGPITALALTAISSIVLLIVLRVTERRLADTEALIPLEACEDAGDSTARFVPVREQAS